MANDERNALAELAHELCGVVVDSRYYATIGECIDMANAIGKARLIIAELAKADATYKADMLHNNICLLAYDALKKCREIAAEGVQCN